MQIMVNGQRQQWDAVMELPELLQQLGYHGNGFAVALNGDFVARAGYAQTVIDEGDSLDIVAPVVGG